MVGSVSPTWALAVNGSHKPTQMYQWRGTNRAGQSVTGELAAASVDNLKYQLRKKGIFATKITVQSSSRCYFGQSIPSAEICVISRQIATMLGAGVTIVKTLDIIAHGHTKPAVQKLLSTVANEVKSGNQLSAALRQHPRYFDSVYCDLVASGEQSGKLDSTYERIASYQERSEALKSKVKKAMFYPLAVLLIALAVTTALLIFVVPQFAAIFNGFGAELPRLTQWVLRLSAGIREFGLAMVALAATMGWTLVHIWRRSPGVRDTMASAAIRLPVCGDLLGKAAIARCTRTLASSLAAGVPLIEALAAAAGAAGNPVYRHALQAVRTEVASGVAMHSAMRATGVFPAMVKQMVAIGEESGSVDAMLTKVADIYEREVNDMLDGLAALLEPVTMTVLGIIIGGLITAVYLPIFQMGMVV